LAVFHPLLEGERALLLATGLQGAVMLPHDDLPKLLLGFNTLLAQTTGSAVSGPGEAKAHFARLLPGRAGTLGLGLPSRTHRLALLHLNLELIGRE
jgi:hypothetical protein